MESTSNIQNFEGSLIHMLCESYDAQLKNEKTAPANGKEFLQLLFKPMNNSKNIINTISTDKKKQTQSSAKPKRSKEEIEKD